MSHFSSRPGSSTDLVFHRLAEEIYWNPHGMVELLNRHHHSLGSNPTLFDINRSVLDAMSSDAFVDDLADLCTYQGFIGLAFTIVMTGVSIVRTWQKTRDNRAKDIAANIMAVKQNLLMQKEAIQKEANTQRRKILVATMIQYTNELEKLRREMLAKNLWAASIVVFAGISGILAWRMLKKN